MGQLVNGKWEKENKSFTDSRGKFIRKESAYRNKIEKGSKHPPEKNRYHLYISYACPWANRASIMRSLKKLKKVISMSSVHYLMRENGWSFIKESPDLKDPLYNLNFLYEIYQKADPSYTGRVSVPVLWDKKEKVIVNNESSEILRIFNSSFDENFKNAKDYYPQKLRSEIDEINDFVLVNINNGVYKCGFAKSQVAYEEAFENLFLALDKLEERLSKSPFLVGDEISEADIRLFTTLIRFDIVYVGHFKCNFKRIVDYPSLYLYMKKIYQIPEVKETINFNHIKRHYYESHLHLNPTKIVPKGPKLIF